MKPALVTHGGTSSDVSESDGCLTAACAGLVSMVQGGDALSAVVCAVSILEADGRYNAGLGASLGMDGKTMSCDASVMDSAGKLGAVANLVDVPHPVQVARRVADTPHHLLVGVGALQFAKRLGLYQPYAPTETALREFREQREALQRAPERTFGPAVATQDDNGLAAIKQFWNFPGDWNDATDQWAHNTVGAVARDASGQFAVALSTGGCMPALLGRVGDSPLIGCGFYAGAAGAIACTGIGEHILRHMLASRIYIALEQGIGLRRAIEDGMKLLPEHIEVGVIGITAVASEIVSRRPMAAAQQ